MESFQLSVVVPLPYLQYIFRQSVQVVPKHSDGGGSAKSKF